MRVVIQRSKNSLVSVDNKVIGKIESGLVVLVAFTYGDDLNKINYMINKIINMRIFDGNPEKSVLELNGELLIVSQFTLYADATKGRRPSYVKSLKSEDAKVLYDLFIEKIKETNLHIETGIFGADMELNITNDGPCTIILDN